MSRQQRRAAEREALKRTLKPRVEAATTIGELWRVYRTRFDAAQVPLEPEHLDVLREVFYAGVASAFDLLLKASGDPHDDSDAALERGAELLNRLHEELDTYAKGLR
jgi:hypothetical protein